MSDLKAAWAALKNSSTKSDSSSFPSWSTFFKFLQVPLSIDGLQRSSSGRRSGRLVSLEHCLRRRAQSFGWESLRRAQVRHSGRQRRVDRDQGSGRAFRITIRALFGSVSCIHFRPDGIEREALEINVAKLESRMAICYTGEPRLSGINNWEVFKRHIDGDPNMFQLFEGIRDSGSRMRELLLNDDWDGIADSMRRAHPNRKQLAPNITTPQMDALIEKALGSGAEAAKVCGAGGGGCMAFLCADPQIT
jgi:hypothetical protein